MNRTTKPSLNVSQASGGGGPSLHKGHSCTTPYAQMCECITYMRFIKLPFNNAVWTVPKISMYFRNNFGVWWWWCVLGNVGGGRFDSIL